MARHLEPLAGVRDRGPVDPQDRKVPMTMTVAKVIIQLAKDGERDPKKLCEGALKILGK